jgi:hypothetical protein
VCLNSTGFVIRGLDFQDSGLNQVNCIFLEEVLRKYTFLSITSVPAIRIEHVRALSKGFSTRNVFWI